MLHHHEKCRERKLWLVRNEKRKIRKGEGLFWWPLYVTSVSTTRAQVLIIVFSPCMYRALRPVVSNISYWIVLVVTYSGQRDHTSFQRCMDCACIRAYALHRV